MSKRLLYILIGGIVAIVIVIVAGVVFLIPTLNATSAQQAAATPTPATVATSTAIHPLNQALKQYSPDIKNQFAQGLHLTPEQLRTQLKAGKTLNDVATAQGVSSDQLQTIIHDAFTNGLKPAVTGGTITQKQVDGLVKRYQKNPKVLERFLGAGAKAA